MTNVLKTRRVGTIKISREFFESDIESIEKLFSWLSFVPLRVEFDMMINRYTMTGHSPRFDEITENEIAPDYEIIANLIQIDKYAYKTEFNLERI